jgi:hypothetical protein
VVALQVAQHATPTLLASEGVMATTPPPGNSTTDIVSPIAATPPPCNSATDTTSLVVVIPPPKKSRKTTRKRDQPTTTLSKEGLDNDVEVITTKSPTKRVREFMKRQPLVLKKHIMRHTNATQ